MSPETRDFSYSAESIRSEDGNSFRNLYRWFFVLEWWSLLLLLQTGVLFYLPFALSSISRYPERQIVLWGIALGSGIVLVFPSAGAATIFMTLHYKCWKLIQDGHARTEPTKAVGLMFAPLFNLYWGFVAFRGLALDMNAYMRRHGLKAPPASVGLTTAYCVGGVLGILPGLRIVSMLPLFALQVLVIRSLKNTAAEIADAQAGTTHHGRQGQLWPAVLLTCACVVSAGLAALVGFLFWPSHPIEWTK